MKSVFLALVIGTFSPYQSLAQEMAQEKPLILQEIQCLGNASTACDFIASHLYLPTGALINDEEIQNAKLRLSSLPNFKTVSIHLEKGAEKGRAIVIIEVTEASALNKELVIGTSQINSNVVQRLAGRVGHQNVFGKGKILSLEVQAVTPLTATTTRDFSSRLQYVDPNLFGSQKYFLISGLTYEDRLYEYSKENFYQAIQAGLDISLGRRLGDFSFLSAGYKILPTSILTHRYKNKEGTPTIQENSYSGVYLLSYGWNSEDDAYFPTQGSRFNTSLAWAEGHHDSTMLRVGIAYRTTWLSDNGSLWTFKWGGTPDSAFRQTLEDDLGLSLAYARTIKTTDTFGGVERGRWYIEPGIRGLGYSTSTGMIIDPGIKAGLRLETKALGIVDIYAIGRTSFRFGGEQ
jgi:outer membrane protein assembly factor BamA